MNRLIMAFAGLLVAGLLLSTDSLFADWVIGEAGPAGYGPAYVRLLGIAFAQAGIILMMLAAGIARRFGQ